ncbi:MAG: proline--tRNA ligase, partial [Candidatus Dormibacteraeota bacterium]|nr:proline--tRNA ligase [Candidatus Dormibacteraeota bacterium]
LGCYRELCEDWLALPVIPGRKTESEKFAGARYTVSIEAMMRDGWALQSGTSHHLGQNFTTVYDITYSDTGNTLQHPFQTSWGLSTRTIGGVIMVHGDDRGLVLPPRVAPTQVVVIPIVRSNDADGSARVEDAVTRIERSAGDVRLRVDRREGIRPGEKYAHWELRGVPLRVVVGAKDLDEGRVTLVRRIDGTELRPTLDELAARLPAILDETQALTFDRAVREREERSIDVATIAELIDAFAERPVFATAPFCNSDGCERSVKEAVHALTVRVLRVDRSAGGAPCIACNEPADHMALMARAY